MMNQHTLFTNVQAYYENLNSELVNAKKKISISFLSFVQGEWAEKISQALIQKAKAGVRVQMIVDEIGEVWDDRKRLFDNINLVHHLRKHGIQVEVFRPTPPMKINNRLHCKFIAIDENIVYIGGSNIADFYTQWIDANLRIDGNLGNTFHTLYDFLFNYSKNGNKTSRCLNA